MNTLDILMIVLLLLFAIVIVLLIYWWVDIEFVYKKLYKELFMAVGNSLETYNESQSPELLTFELDNAIKNIASKDEDLLVKYGNHQDLLNGYITIINTCNNIVEHSNKNLVKSNINKFIQDRNRLNPLETINNLDSVVFDKLIDSVNKSDKEESIEYIKVLAKEFRDNKEKIADGDKKERKQTMISIVSIVLTVVFGIISIIQLFG